MASDVRRTLEPLARPTVPLAKPIKKPDTTWVEPRFDAEITFAEITDDGMVRHPIQTGVLTMGGPTRGT